MFPMFIINVLVVLIIVGLALWVLDQVPIDGTIKRIIRIIVLVLVAVWLIYFLLGFLPAGGSFYPHRN